MNDSIESNALNARGGSGRDYITFTTCGFKVVMCLDNSSAVLSVCCTIAI